MIRLLQHELAALKNFIHGLNGFRWDFDVGIRRVVELVNAPAFVQ